MQYFVRWGVNGDGELDTDVQAVTTNTATISDAVSSAKVKPMTGKDIDVFVIASPKVYATADAFYNSPDYDESNWSALLTVTVP